MILIVITSVLVALAAIIVLCSIPVPVNLIIVAVTIKADFSLARF